MLENLLNLTFESTSVSIEQVLVCTLASIVLGLVVALIYMYKNTYTKSFVITLALLPAMVQLVIMLVNGNVGAGVAVMGAFSLVRFRSVPGTAREIASIFMAMAVGLATGMSCITVAVLFLIIIGIVNVLLSATKFGEQKQAMKLLKITIPENLDYTGIFDDLFKKYTTEAELIKVKTTNMGSLYELNYHVVLKDIDEEKSLIDDIRCRNGNLTIVCGKIPVGKNEL